MLISRVDFPESRGRLAHNNGLSASELGLSRLLPKAVGTSRAFDIMLAGRDVHAEEAERIGLVSHHVPTADLLPTWYDIAEPDPRLRDSGGGMATVRDTILELLRARNLTTSLA